MKMKTRIISLSILAILTACMLNVAVASAATPATAPKPVGDRLLIHADQTSVYNGGSIYFSGYVTNGYGYGIGGMYGYLTDNGYYIQNTNFYTYSDGTWGMWLTFHSAGPHDVAVHCDGMVAVVEVQVY